MTESFKPVFEGVHGALKSGDAPALATFAADSRQVSGLRSEVQARDFTYTVDEPPELGGTDEGPNPVEYILGGLAACQEITYRLYADQLGIPLDGVSVTVKGDIDLRGFFAVDDGVRPGFQNVTVEVEFDSPASDTELQELKETVDTHCPVLDILSNATPTELFWGRGAKDTAAPEETASAPAAAE
jgi:uncharacterized OsmC-like protein